MFPLQFLAFFVGLTLAAPLTSENSITLDRRGSTVECSVRYGWSLHTNDCHAALGMLPVTPISSNGMPMRGLTPAQARQGVTGATSGSTLSRLRDARGFVVQSGKCVIGVNPPANGGINLSDWGAVAGRAYNIINNCVTGKKGQGGKDMAGPQKNIQVMVWQEDPNDVTS